MISIGLVIRVKEMRELTILIIVALIAIAITGFSYWLVNLNPVYHIEEFDMDVYVGRITGFNVDTDAIHFGIVPPTGVSERKIKLKSGPFRSLVTIESYGDIAEWVGVSDNNFIMEPGGNKSITVHVIVPSDAAVPGYEDGKLRIVFKKI